MFDCFLKSATLSTKLSSVVYSILQLNDCSNALTLFKMNQTPQLFDEDEGIFECDHGPQNGKQIGKEIELSAEDIHKWCTMLRDMYIHDVDGSYPSATSPDASPFASVSYVSPFTSESKTLPTRISTIPIPKLRRSNAESERTESLLGHHIVN